jgi:hypothetical protein
VSGLLRPTWLLGATTWLLACQSPAPGDAVPSMTSAQALRAVPTAVEADGMSFTMTVEAWRSFQPAVGRAAGDPLIAVLRVSTSDSAGVPGALRPDGAWLAHGDELVAVQPREEAPREPGARTVEFVVRGGPAWPTGDSLDVVLAIGGLRTPAVLLRAPRTAIARVD